MAGHEVAEPDEDLGDPVRVDWRAIAIALQQLPHARLPHQVACEIEIERRQRVGRVAQHLDGGAARPEHHQRPERGVDRHAEDQLVGVGAADHRLHREALDPRRRHQACDALLHVLRRAPGLVGPLQPEPDAADVGLVRDVVGQDLDHAGAMLRDPTLREGADLGGVARDLGRHRGNAVGRHQPFGLHLRQDGPPRGDHVPDRAACRFAIEAQVLGQRWRRAHQLFLRARVAHELREPVDGLGRRGVAGNALGGKVLAGLAARLVAQPAGNDRLGRLAGARPPLQHRHDLLRNRRPRGERGRAIHDKKRVGAVVAHQHVEGARVPAPDRRRR